MVLYSYTDRSGFGSPAVLESDIRAAVPGTINFYIEYLEGRHFEGEPAAERVLAEHFRDLYSGQKLDLVIVAAYAALQFAVQHRDQLFPAVPIVFMEVDRSRLAGRKMWTGVTGVTLDLNVGRTIDLALQLHSDANTIAVVTGRSQFQQYWFGFTHAELLRRKDKVQEIDLVGLPAAKLLEQVATLPRQTIVLFDEFPMEAAQPAIGSYDLAGAIGKRFPTYCIIPTDCLGHGGVGGVDFDVDEQMAIAAELAKRVLAGEVPQTIPIVHDTTQRIEVDARQLQYWHIPESALPPGSVLLYREPTFWERDRKYIIAAIVVILAQSLLIAALLLHRARRRKAEAVLQESEKRFRVMADTTPSFIWMCDPNGKITYLNHRWAEFTGPDLRAGYGDNWKEFVHPDDLNDLLVLLSQALKTPAAFSNEYRLRRRDGEYRWMFDVVAPRVSGDGSFAGLIGSAIDVSDQRMAQDALANVSGRLIEAQEKERTRIARDLHDDICQRLALLSMGLEQANRNGAPASTKVKLEELRQDCAEIAADVQALSHQLHSSKLDYLGTAAAIRAFCKEFAVQHEADIRFNAENVPSDLPKEISLCLFRVTQEALQNAMKYSGTRHVTVTITGGADEVELVLQDAGAGFDVEEARLNRGLGLVSMQERVNLVHGRFHIESRPGSGTKITAIVPVSVKNTHYSTDASTDTAAAARGAV